MTYTGIAISGKACAGKDVVGQGLERIIANGQVVKLAAPIYQEAIELYSMDPSKKDRPLLQRIGDSHTQEDPTYYARRLVESLITGLFPIVTDVRKVIEAEYLRQMGFALVRLDVDREEQMERLRRRDGYFKSTDLEHWTETNLDHYPYFHVKVPNNGRLSPGVVGAIIVNLLEV